MGILYEGEAIEALQMVDDRNLTVRTYNEALALAIYERLKGYVILLRHWVEEMEKRVDTV